MAVEIVVLSEVGHAAAAAGVGRVAILLLLDECVLTAALSADNASNDAGEAVDDSFGELLVCQR